MAGNAEVEQMNSVKGPRHHYGSKIRYDRIADIERRARVMIKAIAREQEDVTKRKKIKQC